MTFTPVRPLLSLGGPVGCSLSSRGVPGDVAPGPGEERDPGARIPGAAAASDRALAEERDADAQARLAVETDRALAEQGDAGAQGRLGEAYYLGRGTARDFEEALRWARLAAEQGEVRGQGVLAAVHNTGSGVAADPGEALRWARLAAEQGGARGQAVLGFLYSNGRGVPQDDAESLVRILPEITLPHRGRAHEREWGCASPKSADSYRSLSLRRDRLAAEQGNPSAQGLLGMKYMAGRGVEEDFVTGYMWLTLSGSDNRKRLAEFMTPEQVAEAGPRVGEVRRVVTRKVRGGESRPGEAQPPVGLFRSPSPEPPARVMVCGRGGGRQRPSRQPATPFGAV